MAHLNNDWQNLPCEVKMIVMQRLIKAMGPPEGVETRKRWKQRSENNTAGKNTCSSTGVNWRTSQKKGINFVGSGCWIISPWPMITDWEGKVSSTSGGFICGCKGGSSAESNVSMETINSGIVYCYWPIVKALLGGGFKYLLFSSLFGEMIQFD